MRDRYVTMSGGPGLVGKKLNCACLLYSSSLNRQLVLEAVMLVGCIHGIEFRNR
jgi:hypothetical protein